MFHLVTMERLARMQSVMSWIDLKNFVFSSLKVSFKLISVYVVVFLVAGIAMNEFGKWAEIAKFKSYWQIFTTYILYMIPIALLLRNLSWHTQYAYGLIAMGILEFVGYALESSYAYPDNILDQWFGIRNFSLAMTLFFAFYFPVGNALVKVITARIFGKNVVGNH